MAHFPKPEVGSWTEHFGVGTAPVSYQDSISPEFYELERKAIFAKTWLNVGRVERLPRVGNYFTKEIQAAGTSVIVVRTSATEIKAYHNVCRHRGNKLVWQDFPREETSGMCRQFTCKYHGWRYNLDGDLTFIQQESEFFDVDKADYPLVSVQLEVWEGFIFVNLDPENTTSALDFLGKYGRDLAGYPFDQMTHSVTYRATIGANWKLFIDAFMEFYHAPVLHVRQAVAEEAEKLQSYGYEALHYDIDGPHEMVSSWGGMSPPKDLSMVKPIERILRSGLFGPWDAPDVGPLPEGVNPTRSKVWGEDSFLLFPNFMILIWKPNWYLTYHYWPTAHNSHVFECSLYFVPPTTARERLAQEIAASSFKEYGLQDGNTLEATQMMLESRVVDGFPLCDQEVMIRHLHNVVRERVTEYQQSRSETAVSI